MTNSWRERLLQLKRPDRLDFEKYEVSFDKTELEAFIAAELDKEFERGLDAHDRDWKLAAEFEKELKKAIDRELAEVAKRLKSILKEENHSTAFGRLQSFTADIATLRAELKK